MDRLTLVDGSTILVNLSLLNLGAFDCCVCRAPGISHLEFHEFAAMRRDVIGAGCAHRATSFGQAHCAQLFLEQLDRARFVHRFELTTWQ
jgi:hypothetical protein